MKESQRGLPRPQFVYPNGNYYLHNYITNQVYSEPSRTNGIVGHSGDKTGPD